MSWVTPWGKAEHLYCYIGNDSESLRAYSECYPKLNSTADPHAAAAEQIVSTADLVPYEEFRRGASIGSGRGPAGLGRHRERGDREIGDQLHISQCRAAQGPRPGRCGECAGAWRWSFLTSVAHC
jgi:hypothetical protein